MKNEIKKTYNLDDDVLEVTFIYDELSHKHLGDFPDFADNPRYTPNGRKWTDVICEDCPYADGKDKTCGSCSYMLKQEENDIIGVCMNEKLRKSADDLLKKYSDTG